jgi:hypothetical protein
MTQCRSLLLIAVLPALVALTGCQEHARVARTRVEAVLEGLQKGGGDDSGYTQTAIAAWSEGKSGLDSNALAANEGRFRDWANAKGIYRKISSWEIVDAQPDGGSEYSTIVSVKVEGQAYKIRVPHNAKMEWVE